MTKSKKIVHVTNTGQSSTERRHDIYERYKNGESVKSLSKSYHVTQYRIRQIIKKAEQEENGTPN